MWQTWHTLDYEPFFRIDQYPALYELAALLTLVFELGFLPALLWRPSRVLFATMAVAFHIGTGLLMGIWFHTLMILLVMFVDRDHGANVERSMPWSRTLLVGAMLLGGISFAVTSKETQGWPFAGYPGFYAKQPEVVEFVLTVDSKRPKEISDYHLHFLAAYVAKRPEMAPALAEHLNADSLEVTRVLIWPEPDGKRTIKRKVVASYRAGGSS